MISENETSIKCLHIINYGLRNQWKEENALLLNS